MALFRLIFCLTMIGLITVPEVAEASKRRPTIGYVDRSGRVVEAAEWEGGSTIFRGDWVAVSRGGKAGYLNLRTRAFTGLIFDQVGSAEPDRELFSFGPEPVRIDGQWGYTNQVGETVILPRFAEAESFGQDGLAIVKIADPSGFGLQTGMIDRQGRWAVQPRAYQILRRFDASGLAVFMSNGKFGAIDRNGIEIIPPKFGALGNFAENGLAPATLSGHYGADFTGLWGYIDRTGKFVIPEQFTYAGSFQTEPMDGGVSAPPGFARVSMSSREMGYIDASGRVVTRFPANVVVWGVASNNLARFQDITTARYGFVHAVSGEIVIPARFDQVGGFDDEGLAYVLADGKAGYIGKDGQWVIEPRFQSAYDFDAYGNAQVGENGQSKLIDREGNDIALLTHRENFYHQNSAFAAFTVYPGREDAPTASFGDWALDSTLYEMGRTPIIHGPNPVGNVRLNFVCGDIRMQIKSEGYEVFLTTEQGVQEDPDITFSDWKASMPENAHGALNVFASQLNGRAGLVVSKDGQTGSTQPAVDMRAAQIARSSCLAKLVSSESDLEQALAAMRARLREQNAP